MERKMKGSGPNWLFDIDALTNSMNYKPVVAGNQSNGNVGTKACDDNSKDSPDAGFKSSGEEEKKDVEDPGNESGNPTEKKDSEVPSTEEPRINQEKDDNINNTNNINIANDGNSANNVNVVNDNEDVGAEVDRNNLDAFMPVSPIPTTRILQDYSELNQIIKRLEFTTPNKKNTKKSGKNMVCLVQFSKEQTIKTFKIACLLAFYHKKNPRRNKKDERGIVITNKATLVAQGYTQEEGVDYDEVFAPVARIEVIRLFLAYASFKDFVVYQMDVKSAFLYGKIEEEVYVCQPPGFEDTNFPDRRGKIDNTLFIRRDKGDILLVQVYVDDIIFGSTKKSLCTEFEKMMHKKFQMSSMGELTFFLGLYLKGQLKLSLWYPKDSPFDLVAYTDSDYAGASLDRKSTTGGCQFLGCRLILWQCKKQTVVANSTTKAEYVAASIKNPIFYSKIKHIEIRHHFIKDSNEKKLIQMIKIHTDKNVIDLLTKAFDVKTVNREVQLQALVDGKKIIITEETIRRDLQLEDAEGIDCLSNATIFKQLTIIGMVKNVDNVNKILMYPRFVQVFVNQQVGDMSNHKRIYVTPSHTKKFFGNMKREGKGFFGRVTPLFPTMMALEIDSLKRKVKKLEKKQRSRTQGLKRLYKVGLSARVVSSEDEGLGEEDASKQERKIHDINADEDITLENVHDQDMFGVHDLDGDKVIVENINVVKTSKETRSMIEEVTSVIEKDKLVNAAEETVSVATTTTTTTVITDVEMTLAQALAEMKSTKPKVAKVVIQEPEQGTTLLTTTASTTITAVSTRPRAKGIVFHEQEQALTPTVSSQQPSQIKVQDKGKGKMNEPEPVKKLSKNDQLRLDEELAFRLQAEEEEEEEERLAKEKAQ
ncbi:putative reverse transcriptase, RNA-dependent DNA polymerase [Tanacetum coccineum]